MTVDQTSTAGTQLDRRFNERLRTLERRVRLLGTTCVVLTAALLIAARPRAEVLRVRGLVIIDAHGRERIVLGAPMEQTSTNPKLAGASGVAVLDSLGRLAIGAGENVPAVVNGRVVVRVGRANGFNIYDPRTGNERGGMGAFLSGRANICLDYSAAKEAVCSSVADDDSYSAVLLNGTPNEPQYDRVGMFVGADGQGSVKAFGGGSEHTGGIVLSAGKGPSRATVYDSAGKVIRELAIMP